MNKHYFTNSFYALLILCICFTSCNGQNETKGIEKGQLKVVKNHFIPQYSDEFFFMQCGMQDKAGNMWFGSAGDGIYYYDGNTFTNFARTDDLNLNDILCCLEDNSGMIWFGTRRGLIIYTPSGKPPVQKDFTSLLIAENIFDKSTNKKIPYTYAPGQNFVWSIMQDKTGKLWFGTNQGVCIYDPKTAEVDNLPGFKYFLDDNAIINKNHLQLKQVTSMLEDKNGRIWFVADWNQGEGICLYDPGTIVKEKTLTNFSPDSIYAFRRIIERKNGDLLFLSTLHGVYSFNGNSFYNLSEKAGIKNDTLVSIMEDKEGTLWLGQSSIQMKNGGDGGAWRYDGKSLQLFTTKNGLSHNCIFCIVEERNGDIWFGTRNTGLCRFDGKTFTDFTE